MPVAHGRDYRAPVPDPIRPQLRPLPELTGTASPPTGPAVAGAGRGVFIVGGYAAGRSLRELAELTDRSFSAVRNILTRHGVQRRGAGAAVLREPSA